jgi:hypothetical protein
MPPLFFGKACVSKKHSSGPNLPKGDGKTSVIFFLRTMENISRSFQPYLVRNWNCLLWTPFFFDTWEWPCWYFLLLVDLLQWFQLLFFTLLILMSLQPPLLSMRKARRAPPRLHLLRGQTLVTSPMIKNLVVNLIIDSYIYTPNLDHIARITRPMRARSVLFQIWRCTTL